MYESEKELNAYFGGNKNRIFVVRVTVEDENGEKLESVEKYNTAAARGIYSIAQQIPSLSVISRMLVDRKDWYEISVSEELSEFRELLERVREQLQDMIERIANDVRTTGIANKLDEQTICETLQGVWNDSSVGGKRYALTRTYAGTCVEEKLKEQLDICHVQFDTRCKAAAETIAKKIEEYKKFASEEN